MRWPSGVTKIMLVAVAGPVGLGGLRKVTPAARMSWLNTWPSWSSRTRPMKAPRPPSDATAAMVLAQEPPETSRAGPRRR